MFGAQARFAIEAVEIDGLSTVYTRTGDEGSEISFHFCPECGSTVHYTIDDQPDVIAVPVGGFADPDFPAPWVSVYETRRHPWVSVPDDAERYP